MRISLHPLVLGLLGGAGFFLLAVVMLAVPLFLAGLLTRLLG